MVTGLKKWQKTTEIYFSEAKDPITISTFNTSLKNRLTEFAKGHPELCKLVADDEFGEPDFDVPPPVREKSVRELMDEVKDNPMVQEAIDLFGGRLADVYENN